MPLQPLQPELNYMTIPQTHPYTYIARVSAVHVDVIKNSLLYF